MAQNKISKYNYFNSLYSNLSDGIIFINESANIKYLNKVAEKIFNIKFDDIKDSCFDNFFKIYLRNKKNTKKTNIKNFISFISNSEKDNNFFISFVNSNKDFLFYLSKINLPGFINGFLIVIPSKIDHNSDLIDLEQHWKQAVKYLKTFVLAVNDNFQIASFSDDLEFFNYYKKQIIGKPYWEIIFEDKKQPQNCPVKNAFKTKTISHYHFVSNNRTYLLRAIPLFDSKENVNHISLICTDLSEKKNLFHKIIQSEIRYKNFFKNLHIPVAILLYDPKIGFIIKDFNKAAEEKEKISKNELLGKKIEEVFPALESVNFLDELYKVYKTGKPSYLPAQELLTKNGLEWNENFIYKLATGEVVVLYNEKTDEIQTNIALQESEKRYRTVFDKSPIGLLQFDKNGVITHCNNEFVRIIGSSHKALVGLDMIKDLKNKYVIQAVKDALKTGTGKYSGQYKSVTGHKKTFVHVEFVKVFNQDEENFAIGIGLVQDITEQKIAENKLKESRKKLKTIFENASDSIIIGNLKGEIISVNQAFVKLTGYDRNYFVGKHISELFSKEELVKNPLLFEKLNQGKTIIKYRWIKTKNNKQVHIEMNSKKIDNQNYISIIRDLTQRDNTLRALQEEKQRSSAFFKAFPDIFFVMDKEGHFIDYNHQNPDLLLLPPEEFLGKKYSQILPENIVKKTKFYIEKLLKTGDVQTYEYEIERPGMQKEIFEAKLVLLGKNNILSVVRDITKRKEIEQQSIILSKVVEQSRTSIIITNTKGKIEYVNPAFTQISGFSVNQAYGKTPAILKSNIHKPEFYEKIWDTILNGKTWKGEILNKKKNGDKYWTNTIISPIINDKNQITHFFAISEDITEKKQIVEDLKKAKLYAEKSDKLKTSFLQNMSHEIRTPLNGILGFAGLIGNEEEDMNTIKEYANIIAESGTRLLNLINNIIEISKIQSGNVRIEKSIFSLNTLLQEIYKSFVIDADIKGLTLKYFSKLSDNNSFIKTDKEILKNIFTHLIDNAIKYTKYGKILFGYDIVDNKIEFFVKDTGIGMENNQKDIIFDSFYKGEEKETVGIQGSGVGLSIVNSLLKILNGKIWVKSKPKKGSVFYFTIDYSSDFSIDTSYKNKIEKQDKEKVILIAEDDNTSFVYLESILKGHFTEILHAQNGQEAIDFVKNRKEISIVLMDLRLPVLNGIKATQEIKKINPNLPVIAQTAYAFSIDEKDIFNAGCDTYLTKPLRKKELLEEIFKLSS